MRWADATAEHSGLRFWHFLTHLDAYFHRQGTARRMRFDGGADTVRKLGTVVTQPVPLAYWR
jgi:hypothetical protein